MSGLMVAAFSRCLWRQRALEIALSLKASLLRASARALKHSERGSYLMIDKKSDRQGEHIVAPADAAQDGDVLAWQGRLDLFAPLREGGPGRAPTLLIILAISAAGIVWAVLADQSILSDNPLAYVAGIGGFIAIMTVLVIFLLRGLFRRRKVVFVLAPDHAEIRAHAAQERVDAAVNLVADVVTGTRQGQAVAKAHVAWGDVKRAVFLPEACQILLKSRDINLRFHCQNAGRYAQASAIVEAHVKDRH